MSRTESNAITFEWKKDIVGKLMIKVNVGRCGNDEKLVFTDTETNESFKYNLERDTKSIIFSCKAFDFGHKYLLALVRGQTSSPVDNAVSLCIENEQFEALKREQYECNLPVFFTSDTH